MPYSYRIQTGLIEKESFFFKRTTDMKFGMILSENISFWNNSKSRRSDLTLLVQSQIFENLFLNSQ
jgi:hypothetical protein